VALASSNEVSVLEDLGVGVWVDWTRQVLVVEVVHHPKVAEVQRQTELVAIVDMDAALVVGAKRVRVLGTSALEDELGKADAGMAMLRRLTRRTVVEARYGREGSLGMTAELPLEVLLRPWTLERLDYRPLDGVLGGPFTGVVLDARGVHVDPAWAPRIITASGEVLYGDAWSASAAVGSTPAVYVVDPSHSAAQRAGASPLILRVEDAAGSDLVLAETDEGCLISAHSAQTALRRGRLVIVVDP
jgi:hypothetical protein